MLTLRKTAELHGSAPAAQRGAGAATAPQATAARSFAVTNSADASGRFSCEPGQSRAINAGVDEREVRSKVKGDADTKWSAGLLR